MQAKIIHAPTIILATKTIIVESESLSEYTSNCKLDNGMDSVPELAGRICYQSFEKQRPGGNDAYLANILESGHGNVMEHAYVGFLIKGVSRSLTHELIRHRAGTGVSQLSQRFCDKVAFVMPPLALENDELYFRMNSSFQASVFAYEGALELTDSSIAHDAYATLAKKRQREAARAVLPNAVETHLLFTANLRAWRNILEQRGSIHADLEIRRLACELAVILKDIAPSCFRDVDVVMDKDGRKSVRIVWRKV